MIAMRPVKEPQVISDLNNGRFIGEIEGYIIMDGPEYLGHILYEKRENTTFVIDADIKSDNNMLVDGAVRACVAAGQYKGATDFAITSESPCLIKWRDVFCKTDCAVPNEKLFAECK